MSSLVQFRKSDGTRARPGSVPPLALIALSILVVQPGCSLFVPHSQMVHVASNRPDAEIFIDGKSAGRGSASVSLKRDATHQFVAVWRGKQSTASSSYGPSLTGKLDIIGGIFFLFPFLGLLSPGFFAIDRDSVELPFYDESGAVEASPTPQQPVPQQPATQQPAPQQPAPQQPAPQQPENGERLVW